MEFSSWFLSRFENRRSPPVSNSRTDNTVRDRMSNMRGTDDAQRGERNVNNSQHPRV